MRKLAGTVTIVSATDGKQRYALVATAVTSVSLEPPTLLVCVNKDASIHSILGVGERFCVNLLSHCDADVAAHCMSSKGEDRFLRGDWQSGEHGTPWLMSAQACLFGTVQSQVDWHTHSVFFAHITSTMVADGTCPLLYADGGFGMFRQAGDSLARR
jgi:flavin reductase (DIM6/NTAB) family NADH-FMN oxidoreductase RutF